MVPVKHGLDNALAGRLAEQVIEHQRADATVHQVGGPS